jgi:hypothetical protein
VRPLTERLTILPRSTNDRGLTFSKRKETPMGIDILNHDGDSMGQRPLLAFWKTYAETGRYKLVWVSEAVMALGMSEAIFRDMMDMVAQVMLDVPKVDPQDITIRGWVQPLRFHVEWNSDHYNVFLCTPEEGERINPGCLDRPLR